MTDRWIVIPNWDKFQHYKDRQPPWIKDYLEQLDRDQYLGLTFAERGLLSDIRKLYCRRGRALTDDTKSLSRALNQRVLRKQLQRLADAGLIEFSASKPLAKPYQPASTRDREDKKKGKNNSQAFKRCPECGIALTPPLTLTEHIHLQHQEGGDAQ